MAVVINMPRLSDTMEEGVVAKWHVKVGDQVNEGDLLAEIETDKATMDFEAFPGQEGKLLYIGVQEGETAPVDNILCILGSDSDDVDAILNEQGGSSAKEEKAEPAEAEKSGEKETPSPAPVATDSSDSRVKASPLAKKMAEEKGISLSQVSGSGEGGRIVKRDIDSFVPSSSSSTSTSSNSFAVSEGYTDIPVTQMRKTIARRLAESKFTAPHFYLTIEIDMDNAVATRKRINDRGDVKVSFNDLVIKAAAVALTKHPAVNSSWMGDSIRQYDHVNIGVAVAVEEGLLVPVVRHANAKGLVQISAEVRESAQKAKDKKLQPSDWEGNTFTISNLGMFGIEEFTAIVNPPDSCIMAVGGIRQVPVVKDGQVVPGNVMKVTLSCDHRVVDGAKGAAFLQTFKQMMEEPVSMLL
ncbi:pyruvate dehydrogenase complex dihydrolipoamide acetyltransferase [Phaeocystidibacter marisrubri]|uniref:Acetyltransferase component of pyruvate dehydrogenase complex n=1 Tax=Phaeocystidibacter marisrubri TaxID=1577780 RepID=A0A6L3ZGL1_9FLAO|nr:pyruvate dehydrogenase complex dihydrolipoamide acetyltransferase [Phaeocystidibacter marisrubri]KAB2816977.1 pyruvate dehydrogenase complex dihydrolipoamide acetyltransferase [Phaeocystidibacter marisrubri]GGH77359.1 dihydrolipoamide acetyltransferase component of pyruvate dehydrogenase complex [Phaeocystidibacter marisrubri]